MLISIPDLKEKKQYLLLIRANFESFLILNHNQDQFMLFNTKNVRNSLNLLYNYPLNIRMGQQQTLPRSSYTTARSYQTSLNQLFYDKRIEHEGLLKLRDVPFKNCIQIQTQSTSLFLQNIQITLKDLLESRLYTNKLFPKEDIQKLIQNVTYTLAYLQYNKVPYKDICAQNVFYDDGIFKLLPNQLIAQSRYKRFLALARQHKQTTQSASNSTAQKQFITLSPQMIIAYRCQQTNILDMDILDKSNVFYLGLLLLQVATLLPSHECYDIETSDILDQVITERIQLVKQYYSEETASILANMLDYDYAERMNLKQLSIFVNRQLNREFSQNRKINKELSNKKLQLQAEQPAISISPQENVEQQKSRPNHSNSKIISISKSRNQNQDQTQSRISKPSQVGSISQKKKNKTNKIYMNGGTQQREQQESTFTRQQRNKVYMKSAVANEQRKPYLNNESSLQNQLSTSDQRHISCMNNNANGSSRIREQSGKLFNPNNVRQDYSPPTAKYKPRATKTNNQEQEQNRYPTNEQYSRKYTKQRNNTDHLGCRINNNNRTSVQQKYQQSIFQRQDQRERQPLNQIYNYQRESDFTYNKKQGVFGPRFSERQSLNEDSGSRGYFNENRPNQTIPKLNSNTEFKEHDHSLSRIKSQIQRSRKLISEFKRGQNCQF